MIEEPDAILTRLFAEQSHPELGADFMARFIDRLGRAQRKQRTYRVAMIIAGAIVAALLAPWIAQAAAAAIGALAAGMSATLAPLNFPTAWLLIGSIAGGFLPVIYLATTQRW
jgi:anti-sigma factor RsiW